MLYAGLQYKKGLGPPPEIGNERCPTEYVELKSLFCNIFYTIFKHRLIFGMRSVIFSNTLTFHSMFCSDMLTFHFVCIFTMQNRPLAVARSRRPTVSNNQKTLRIAARTRLRLFRGTRRRQSGPEDPARRRHDDPQVQQTSISVSLGPLKRLWGSDQGQLGPETSALDHKILSLSHVPNAPSIRHGGGEAEGSWIHNLQISYVPF